MNGLSDRLPLWSLRMDAKLSLGEPRVLVSRQALLHNASVVRKAVGPGVDGEDLGDLIDTIQSHASLKLSGLCTHFACAEDLGNEATARQLQMFSRATDAMEPRLKTKVTRHAANSAAVFNRPESHFDM